MEEFDDQDGKVRVSKAYVGMKTVSVLHALS
jgi:hypothetical protein